jgi:hypothetical protein
MECKDIRMESVNSNIYNFQRQQLTAFKKLTALGVNDLKSI